MNLVSNIDSEVSEQEIEDFEFKLALSYQKEVNKMILLISKTGKVTYRKLNRIHKSVLFRLLKKETKK